MAVTEPSQKPLSDGLAILISCHALAQNIRRTSSGSFAIFAAIRRALVARDVTDRDRLSD
jgi:hypothetical protein